MRILAKLFWGVIALAIAGLLVFFLYVPASVEKGRNAVAAHDPYAVSDAAQTLHDSLIVGDWHADSLLWNRDLSLRANRGQVDIPRLQEGNVALQMFTAVTKSPKGLNYDHNDADAFDNITLLAVGQLWPIRTWTSLAERALFQAEKLYAVQSATPDDFKIIRTRTDLEAVLTARAGGDDIVGGLLGIEGAHPLEGDIANLDRLEAAGYRMIALQHFFDNELGGTLHSRENNGLTDFGRLVVKQVQERGMILDIAHSSQQVARDVLGLTSEPVIVSHTGVHGHCQNRRNYPDDLMQAIAATGGVIGMGYWAEAACDDSPDGIAASIKAAIAVVGEDHVSLGSDFDGSVGTTFDTSELAALTDALLRAGVSEPQIRKVMGENMLRVLRTRLPE